MNAVDVSVPRLRPLNLGELLDQVIRLYRRNFLTFVGILALVQLPLAILQLALAFLTSTGLTNRLENPAALEATNPFEILGPEYFIGIGSSFLLSILGLLLIQGVASAALTRAIADSYLGRPSGIFVSYRRIGRSWLDLVAALFLGGLLLLGLSVWAFFVPCVGWFTGPGILAFLAMGVIPLTAPVVVLEKRQAVQALRRAWDLARTRFWWVMGFVFVLYVFAQVVVGGPSALLGLALNFVGGDATSTLALRTVVASLVTLAFGLLYYPLQLAAIALLYFDLRVRSEGFDLSLLAEGAKGEKLDVVDLATQAPAQATSRLITWKEVGYFAVLSLVVGAGFTVLWVIYMVLIMAGAAAGGV
jgi:hypothetical protein